MSPSLLRIPIILLMLIKSMSASNNVVADNPPCLDSYICARRTIKGPNPKCYGFKSCAESKINSSEQLECTGGQSCIQPFYLEAQLNITCSGAESCKKAGKGYLKSREGGISCLSENSCSQTELHAVHGEIQCSAMQSCKSTDITCQTVKCYGEKSCHLAYHVETFTDYFCDGDQSCLGTTANAQTLYARGYKSGNDGNLYVYQRLDAFGYMALDTAKVSARTLNAFGYRSAKDIKLDSKTVQDMTINMFGQQAGIEGNIVCREGHQCTLHCKGNACDTLKFLCEAGSECAITPSQCMEHAANSKSVYVDFVACPIYITARTGQDIEEEWLKIQNKKSAPISKLDEGFEPEEEEEMAVSTESVFQSPECDEVEECFGRVFTSNDEDAICLGFLACREAVFNFDDDIQCYGYQSCMDAVSIVTDGSREDNGGLGHGTGKGYVKCWSTESCYKAQRISAANVVTCYGLRSCADVPLIESIDKSIRCESSKSCENSKLVAEEKVNCFSDLSCHGAVIESKSALCSGYEGCKAASIKTTSKLECRGHKSCIDSAIETKSYIASGSFPSADSVIKAQRIVSVGYGGLAFSKISPLDKKISVQSLGYESGHKAELTCQSGQQCRLQCDTDGCLEMTFNCYLGSKCFVLPKGCPFDEDADNVVSDAVINGTACPKWMYQKESRQPPVVGNSHSNDPLYLQIMSDHAQSEEVEFTVISNVMNHEKVSDVNWTVIICGLMVLISGLAVLVKVCLLNDASQSNLCSVNSEYQQIV